jgi:NAD(P)-dependent dehydrogenase (short-subunit alcohol dehydrogenase family)
MKLPKTPSLRLDGKRAMVTGAGRGIGLACAVALAEAGAHVVLAARTEAEVEQAAAAIRKAGLLATHEAVDVTDIAGLARAVAAHAPLDIFVNNAGGARHEPFLEVTEAAFDQVMTLNVRAAFFAAQAAARVMAQAIAGGQEGGSIITVSSQMGHVGGPNRSVYAATKHAMEGMTKAAAIDLGKLGIRINTLCPTFIETPMTRPFFDNPGFAEWVLGNIRLGRVGQVEDLMGAVVFLASDAARFMTGSALMVDGGWTAA